MPHPSIESKRISSTADPSSDQSDSDMDTPHFNEVVRSTSAPHTESQLYTMKSKYCYDPFHMPFQSLLQPPALPVDEAY
jgi:hypothetical protein